MHMLTKRMLGCLAVTGALALSLAPAAYAAGEPGTGSASVADPVSAQVVEVEGDGAVPQAENDVARIGDTAYATLGEAVDAANKSTESGTVTIELLQTANLDKTIAIQQGKQVVITADADTGIQILDTDRKGITLSTDSSLKVENVAIDTNGQFYLNGQGGSLTFSNVDLNMDGEMYQFNKDGYYCCAISIEKPESNLTFDACNVEIANYPSTGSAIRWNGSGNDSGYAVSILNGSHLKSTNCYSGFVGTCDIKIYDSDVEVIEHRGNGSNGSYYDIQRSTVTYRGNGSHGISAGGLSISDHSTVTSSENGLTGVYVGGGDFYLDGTSSMASNYNGAKGWGAGLNLTNNGTGTVEPNAKLELVGNGGDGLDNQRTTVMHDGAKVTITNNSDENGGGIYNPGDLTLPSDAQVYNNHATASGDDIYSTGSITFGRVGSDWKLDGVDCDGNPDDCTDTIDGWYDDSTDARWEAHAGSYDGIHVEEYTFDSTITVNGPLALKAAHGLGVVAVDPADITIYMGGDEGYEGTATDGGAIAGSNSLPEPGFYFVLSNDINQAFADADIADLGEAADLSKYMTIYTNDKYTGEQLHWKLEKYGKNNSEAYGKFIYRIVPAPTEGQEAVPVRLQFTGDDGTSVTSDEFDPSSAGTLSETYEMQLYTELVQNDQVVFEVDVNGEKYYNSMELQTGELNVRYVTGSQDSVMSDVLSSEDELAAARAESPDSAFALLPEGTVYYVNGSSVDVADGVAPSLLFDDVVSDHNTAGADDYDQQLANRAAGVATANGADFENPYYQAKYLDLVDVNNGNVWLTASEPVTVYWPYPEGTDEGTEFHLVHFSGLDRTMANGDIQGAIEASAAEYVAVENTEHGIRFTTEGFSPFVLIWDAGAEAGPQPEPTTRPAGNKNGGGLAKTGDDTSFAAAACAAAAGVALVGAGVVASKSREG